MKMSACNINRVISYDPESDRYTASFDFTGTVNGIEYRSTREYRWNVSDARWTCYASYTRRTDRNSLAEPTDSARRAIADEIERSLKDARALEMQEARERGIAYARQRLESKIKDAQRELESFNKRFS